MDMRAKAQPLWGAVLLGGMAADHVQTLPADDPWRHASARVGEGEDAMVRFEVPRPPEATGAELEGAHFGGEDSGKDLVDLGPGDPGAEVATAALAGGLEPAAAAVLAFAADGWLRAALALLAAAEQGSPIFETGAAALRWAMWRRRAYVGADDPLTMLSAMQWAWRARTVEESGELVLAGTERQLIAAALAEYAIPAGAYEQYRLR